MYCLFTRLRFLWIALLYFYLNYSVLYMTVVLHLFFIIAKTKGKILEIPRGPIINICRTNVDNLAVANFDTHTRINIHGGHIESSDLL